MAAAPVPCQGAFRQGAESMGKSDPEREKRLAEALRANLRRRKAQARREDEPSPSQPADAGRAPPSPLEGEG